jgi:hypothetical protein
MYELNEFRDSIVIEVAPNKSWLLATAKLQHASSEVVLTNVATSCKRWNSLSIKTSTMEI